MKKTLKTLLALMAGTMALAACSEDAVINNNATTLEKVQMTFLAFQESDGTRASIDGVDSKKINWQSSDQISVFDGTSNNNYTIETCEGTSAKFTGTAASVSSYAALYPYQSGANLSSSTITGVTLPASQTATIGSFDPAAGLMMAETDALEKEFAFKNAVSYIKVTTGQATKSISVRSLGTEYIAGTVTLSYNAGAPTATVTGSGTNTVTLVPGSGTTIAAGTYYIAVLPQTLARGFQLSYIDENDITYTRNYNSSYTTVRNKVVNMGVLSSMTCNRPCANNQIIYYASAQQTLNSEGTINNEAPNITSHVYADGVGTITFAADISSVKTIFWQNSNITKVILPATLTEIGLSTFNGCSSLSSADIPQSVTNIGDYAFSGCSALTSVVLPSGIQTLGKTIFYSCNNLKTISLPDISHLTAYTRFGAPNVEKFIVEGVEKCEIIINNTLIDYAKANPQTSYTVPTGVQSINTYVFSGANNLQTVIFPSTLTSIGEYAFYGCTNLETIQIPSSVITLSRGCFYVDIKCSITFESGTQITEIPDYAFSNVVYAEIPTSVKTIGYNSYYGYNKKHTTKAKIVLHEGLTTIGEQAFYDSYNIEEITVPSTVTKIGNNAFACSKQAMTTTSPAIAIPEDQQTRIKVLNVKATTPPTGFTSLFFMFSYDNNYLDELTIYVPTGSVGTYKAAAGWSQYADKIQGKDF